MAVPKSKVSRQRRDKRRSSVWKLEAPAIVKCPNCGASCSVDSHFCSRCGMVLHEQSDLVPTQPQEEQPQQAEQAEQPINQEEKPLIEEKL